MSGAETASPEPKIEALLNQAIASAVDAHVGLPATTSNLKSLSNHARLIVCAQAEAGMWREWTIVDARDFQYLSCTFERRATSVLPGPLIVPRWDFTRTPLKFLATWSPK